LHPPTHAVTRPSAYDAPQGQDALWFALGANRANGVRMGRADVRKAIGIALMEFAERSNREIAKQIGCSDHTVGCQRTEMESTAQIAQFTKTIGADGKSRPTSYAPRTSATFDGKAQPAHVCGGRGGHRLRNRSGVAAQPAHVREGRDVRNCAQIVPARRNPRTSLCGWCKMNFLLVES
jgi:hypothetical protein